MLSLKVLKKAGWIIGLLPLAAGCGPQIKELSSFNIPQPIEQADLTVGYFSSDTCFLNKLASEGFGQSIYTKANFQYFSDGTGTNHFTLYFDEACENPEMEGEAPFTYSITHIYGKIRVLQIDQQNDSENPQDIMRYYLPALIEETGYTMDVEYRNGSSGPYLDEPTELDIAEFIADPHGRGVFFGRQ